MSSLIISYSVERTNYNYNYTKIQNKASIWIALLFIQLKKIDKKTYIQAQHTHSTSNLAISKHGIE